MRKIIIAISGASGALYAKYLLEEFKNQKEVSITLIISKTAKKVWEYELGNKDYENYSFETYDENDLFAPPSSGSAAYESMIICPCSMGTLGRIASGTSDNLIVRAADVILKEKKLLILAIRESPYNLIQLENMTKITKAGGIVFPLSPSFYQKPKKIEDLILHLIKKMMRLMKIDIKTFEWGNTNSDLLSN